MHAGAAGAEGSGMRLPVRGSCFSMASMPDRITAKLSLGRPRLLPRPIRRDAAGRSWWTLDLSFRLYFRTSLPCSPLICVNVGRVLVEIKFVVTAAESRPTLFPLVWAFNRSLDRFCGGGLCSTKNESARPVQPDVYGFSGLKEAISAPIWY